MKSLKTKEIIWKDRYPAFKTSHQEIFLQNAALKELMQVLNRTVEKMQYILIFLKQLKNKVKKKLI